MAEGNRNYKDRLFCFLFGNEQHKDWTLDLYNAVNNAHFNDPEQITFTTIKEVLYLGMHNDVSFLINGEMNMFEQQSTYNPNMPFRLMQYNTLLYDQDIARRNKNIYGSSLVSLPFPRMNVFYNGQDDREDDEVLELRDAFPTDKQEEPAVAVKVRVININKGRSPSLMAACKPLYEYAWIIDEIRHLKHTLGLNAAIDHAIDNMPNDFVIKHSLEINRSEVKGMLILEYNEEKQMELFKEEGREEGLEEGLEIGRVEGLEEGLEKGRVEGCDIVRVSVIRKLVNTKGYSTENAMDFLDIPKEERPRYLEILNHPDATYAS